MHTLNPAGETLLPQEDALIDLELSELVTEEGLQAADQLLLHGYLTRGAPMKVGARARAGGWGGWRVFVAYVQLQLRAAHARVSYSLQL